MEVNRIEELKNKIINGYKLHYNEALELSKTQNKSALYDAANNIREYFCGNTMDLCSITNAKSGKCSEDCQWCSQSKHNNTNIEEYDIVDKNHAVEQAKKNAEQGINRYSLVTSGRSINNKKLNELVDIYKEIKLNCKISLCASMGLLKKEQLEKLKDTGISHYHCNLETAPSFFDNLCSTHSIEEKIQTIKHAKELGMKVCSGGIIGMGETMEQRIELAYALCDLDILSIPINILNPVKGTGLENSPALSQDEVLVTIALFRFINPKASLRFAGGRMQIKSYQDKALKAGINAALVGNLLTTIGSSVEEDIVDFTKIGFTIE